MVVVVVVLVIVLVSGCLCALFDGCLQHRQGYRWLEVCALALARCMVLLWSLLGRAAAIHSLFFRINPFGESILSL